jgi:hypothetical protein
VIREYVMKEMRLSVSVLLIICVLIIPMAAQSDSNEAITRPAQDKPDANQTFIDPLSVRPLYLIQVKGEEILGMATGFVVQKGNKS